MCMAEWGTVAQYGDRAVRRAPPDGFACAPPVWRGCTSWLGSRRRAPTRSRHRSNAPNATASDGRRRLEGPATGAGPIRRRQPGRAWTGSRPALAFPMRTLRDAAARRLRSAGAALPAPQPASSAAAAGSPALGQRQPCGPPDGPRRRPRARGPGHVTATHAPECRRPFRRGGVRRLRPTEPTGCDVRLRGRRPAGLPKPGASGRSERDCSPRVRGPCRTGDAGDRPRAGPSTDLDGQ